MGLALALAVPAQAVDLIDVQGFEGYSIGNLSGQDGWTTAGLWGDRPVGDVVIAEGPGGSGKVMAFRNAQTESSAQKLLGFDAAATHRYIISNFDYYRDGTGIHNNFYWWPTGTNPYWGFAWDNNIAEPSKLYPFGQEGSRPWVAVTPQQWMNIYQIWDTQDGKGSAWVNGQLVADNISIADPAKQAADGWFFGEWQTVGTGEPVYLDNLKMIGVNDLNEIPEPATLALLAGALPLLGLRRRKSF